MKADDEISTLKLNNKQLKKELQDLQTTNAILTEKVNFFERLIFLLP